MKFTKIAAAMLLAVGLFANVACNDAKRTESESTETTAAAKITDKAYICPMKCEGSASDSVGKCPVCAMDLETNSDYTSAAAPADATETTVTTDSAATK